MRVLQTSKFIVCALLVIACTNGVAQQPGPAPQPVKARDLLEQNVQIGEIAGGTTLSEALNRLFTPWSAWNTNVGGQTVNCINWGTSSNAELLPVPAMKLEEMKLKDALAKVVEAAGAEYSTNFSGSGASVAISVSRKPSTDMNRLVYFEFPGWPLDAVMKNLLEGTGMNYILSSGLNNLSVNATLKGVPLETAIGAVIKAVGAEYGKEGNIIHVSSSMSQTQALGNARFQQAVPAPSVAPGTTNAQPQQKVVSRAVQTQHINPGEIAPIISRQGLQVLSTNSNQSVITGPEQQVNEAASLIAALDSVESLPRPVKISVTAKAVWNAVGKKPMTAIVNPAISTAESREAATSISTEVKGNADEPGMNVDFRLRALPVLLSNGQISVSGSFAFQWTVKDNSVNHVLFSSQDVPITVALEPGKQQSVANIKMGGGKEGSEGVLEVFLTATIEKGRVSPANNLGGFGGGSPGRREW